MEVNEPLQEFISDELLSSETPVALDDNLLADSMIDSMGVVRLVAFVEERFGCRIPPEDITIDNFRTINRLADYLRSRIDGAD